jgi:extradiol dioxygenase family protein
MTPILHLSIPVDDLEAARAFYVDGLGCAPGDATPEGADVWFYGLQLTLQVRPDEVVAIEAQGVRHFGVTLPREELDALVARLEGASVRWVSPLETDTTGEHRGKTSAKVADPSGNVVELKSYDDPRRALGMP